MPIHEVLTQICCAAMKRKAVKVGKRRRRGIYTHLEGNGVYMREGHCLHGSGPAEEGTNRKLRV